MKDDRFEATDRADWRTWLAASRGRRDGVWLVSPKRSTGRVSLTYEEAIEEALCFGWIDGQTSTLDGARNAQWFAPRRRGSTWARSNKERVLRLEAAGLMTEAGRAAIRAAQADGSWTVLDSVEALEVPADLAAALAARAGAREWFDSVSPSRRKMILGWIATAKRPETRAARIQDVASSVALKQLPGPLRPRD